MSESARSFAVAAVIPARDAMPFVVEAVQSALAQRLPLQEIVVIDDGSTDGTGDAIEKQFGGSGIVRVLRGRFGSAAAARNAGWRAATSPWVAFLDADDLWFPEKLSTAATALASVPSAGWFFSDGAFLTLAGETHRSWLSTYCDLPEPYAGHPIAELIEVNFVLTSSVIVRRDLLEATGGFDETLSHAEDVDLWIRLSRRAPATASRQALVRYQHRPGGLTRQIGARLQGDVALFDKLARDPELDPVLRGRARRRAALSHYKMAFTALREGNGGEARSHLPGAWLFPSRVFAVVGLWAASWLPAGLLSGLRRQNWAKQNVALPMLNQTRVMLRAEPDLIATPAGGRS